MEKVYNQNRTQTKSKSGNTLAWILIGIGLLCLFGGFPSLHLHHIINPVVNVLRSIFHFFFSWPFILLFLGILLLAGKRIGGTFLLIIGALFLLPKLFILSGLALFFFFPIALIVIGLILIAHLF